VFFILFLDGQMRILFAKSWDAAYLAKLSFSSPPHFDLDRGMLISGTL
jgi:hypothetical protein